MKNYLALVTLPFLLGACTADRMDSTRNAMVVTSGPYRYVYKEKPGMLYRLVNDNYNTKRKILSVPSAMRFVKTDGSGEEFSLRFKPVSESSGTQAQKVVTNDSNFVSPGTYSLQSFSFLIDVVDYDSEMCGKITVDIKPGEIAYIGMMMPDPRTDMRVKRYQHFIPTFQTVPGDEILDARYIAQSYEGPQDDRVISAMPFTVRLPQNEQVNPPKNCLVEK